MFCERGPRRFSRCRILFFIVNLKEKIYKFKKIMLLSKINYESFFSQLMFYNVWCTRFHKKSPEFWRFQFAWSTRLELNLKTFFFLNLSSFNQTLTENWESQHLNRVRCLRIRELEKKGRRDSRISNSSLILSSHVGKKPESCYDLKIRLCLHFCCCFFHTFN